MSNNNRYQNNLDVCGQWLCKQITARGAIKYGTERINPYFANYAAIGLTCNTNSLVGLVALSGWIKWYLSNWNYKPADIWGMQGTIYDFKYDPVTQIESHLEYADSTDSYAATFLSLMWHAYQTGNENIKNYIKGQVYPLEVVGNVITKTLNEDLTWCKPDWRIKYLMDNCEVYRGLRDLVLLWRQLGFLDKARYYEAKADGVLAAINKMWLDDAWETSKGKGKPDLSVWYPDAVVQLFPVLTGIVEPTDKRAISVYAKFNEAWKDWDKLIFSKNESFPWVLIACAAALMRDAQRVDSYLTTIEYKFQSKNFMWPWYSMEAGWYMRLNAYLLGKRPF